MANIPLRKLVGGYQIPGIGLGTWMSTDEAELESALDVALESGYRHFDTAIVYFNEPLIGRVMKKWFSTGKIKREELFITAKLPISGIHEERVEMFLKKSLENLQLDYLDLYLIHFPVGTNYVGSILTPPDQLKLETGDHLSVWKKLEEQVDAGRTKSIGLSNFNKRQIQRILDNCRIKPACLQVELHASLQQKELVDYCHKNNIVVIAYSPLGNPGYNKFLESVGQEGKELPNNLQNPVVKTIAEKHKKSAGQVLLRFLVERNIVPIPKSVTPKRIRENLDIFDFSLDKDDMKLLDGLERGENARICDFGFFPPLRESPEFPFPG